MRVHAATALISLLAGCTGFEANTPDAAAPDYSATLLAADLVLPLGVAVNDRHAYVLELGPNNTGNALDGLLSRVDKQSGCVQGDAGCRDILAEMRFQALSLTLAPDDACWIEFYDTMRELWCFSISTTRLRRMAANQNLAFALASDSANLYWVNGGANGSIQTTPLAHSAPTALASGRSSPSSVAADADGLYWSEHATVIAAGKAGESPHPLAMNLRSPAAVKPLGEWIYFVEQDGGRVLRAKKDGSSIEPLAEGETNPIDLAVDDAGVYWIAQGTPPNFLDGQIVRADLDGQHRRVVAADQPIPTALAADADQVYWVVQGTEGANYLDGALWRAPKGR